MAIVRRSNSTVLRANGLAKFTPIDRKRVATLNGVLPPVQAKGMQRVHEFLACTLSASWR